MLGKMNIDHKLDDTSFCAFDRCSELLNSQYNILSQIFIATYLSVFSDINIYVNSYVYTLVSHFQI